MLGLVGGACGADTADAPELGPLTPEQQRGRGLALSEGCVSCHGIDFSGGVGPGWVGLAGSTVALDDGTSVVADDAFLARAITDPGAQVREGSKIAMPENELTDAQVADLVAFLHALSDSRS